MSAVDDQLVLSEERATAALSALKDDRDGTTAMIMAALAQRDAMHALTLAIVEQSREKTYNVSLTAVQP